MPITRSCVFTMHAITSENVENTAEPMTISSRTPRMFSGCQVAWMCSRSARMYTITPCDSARTLAEIAFPSTSETREIGLTRYFCSTPMSRSRIADTP